MQHHPIDAAGYSQYPQALGRQLIGGGHQLACGQGIEMAEIGDGLRGPLGRQLPIALAVAP